MTAEPIDPADAQAPAAEQPKTRKGKAKAEAKAGPAPLRLFRARHIGRALGDERRRLESIPLPTPDELAAWLGPDELLELRRFADRRRRGEC